MLQKAVKSYGIAFGEEESQIPRVQNVTLLSWSVRNRHEAVVKLLLINTGKVGTDSKDKFRQTPLSLAAESGHEAVAKLLLATGQVEVDSKDKDGQTPLN